jgi:hypothetical protein
VSAEAAAAAVGAMAQHSQHSAYCCLTYCSWLIGLVVADSEVNTAVAVEMKPTSCFAVVVDGYLDCYSGCHCLGDMATVEKVPEMEKQAAFAFGLADFRACL